ncbi:Trifunctional nucleotide phosphoesterase protein YfkN precursor [compost metagenome]
MRQFNTLVSSSTSLSGSQGPKRSLIRHGLGLAAGVSMLFASGCGLFAGAPLAGGQEDLDFHTHGAKGIPTSAGVPSFGQQPKLPQDPSVVGKAVPLTLLYTADVHSRIDPFPTAFYHNTYAGKGGLGRIATMARQLKQQNPNALLLDSGDYLQGTPYFNFFKGDVELKAYQQAGFDAITIGNHEFDNGVPMLRQALGHYKGPIITSNVTFSPDMGQRYAVLKAGNVRVGLFSLLTEVSGLVTPPNFQTAKYYDPVKVAQAAVEKLSKEADIIVCMSHVGIVPPWSEEDPAGHSSTKVTDEVIAQKVPGIDVILSGHTHAMVSNPIVIKSGSSRTLIVAPGYGGGYLGKLDLVVKDGEVQQYNNNLVPLSASVASAPDIEGLVAPYRAKMNQTIQQRIGTAQGDFRRYAGADSESSLNNLMADATLAAARKIDPAVEFGISSSGTPRNYIVSGPITIEDAYYALPFDNKVVIVEAKGDKVVQMLTTQRRWTDNKRHSIANASYTLHPSARKISEIVINGKPFDPKKTYKVAVNDYIADGGSGFSMVPGLKRTNTEVLQRDALIDYIKQIGTLFPQTGRIKIAG